MRVGKMRVGEMSPIRPENLLEMPNVGNLNRWLAQFWNSFFSSKLYNYYRFAVWDMDII